MMEKWKDGKLEGWKVGGMNKTLCLVRKESRKDGKGDSFQLTKINLSKIGRKVDGKLIICVDMYLISAYIFLYIHILCIH